MSIKITPPEVETYLKQLYDEGDPVQHEMEALARDRKFPIVGPLCGRHLYQLAQLIGARRVFELGSGYGYSALFFSRAVGEEGQVHCTELDQKNIALAEDFLSRAGVWSRVTYHQQEATEALRQTGGTWDIIYNDIGKEVYPAVIELAYRHLRPGGLFISDNVLWSGRVFDGQPDDSASTRAIIEFTRQLFNHPGFSTTILPVRDGLSVALRV
ncbi:MAG: O-methyltransferase [Anaerolineaceae bacterium]|nr:O-methyltransferase [Anaerolineaceae bacterium]MCB9098472.1 O-methyltransferase [Anaerolineales bacterium]